MTDETTAASVVTEGWAFADVIAVSRADSEFFSAVVCGANSDFASSANVFASVWTLLSAVVRELRPFAETSTLPRLVTEVLSWSAAVQ